MLHLTARAPACRDALDLNFPEQPAERALLEVTLEAVRADSPGAGASSSKLFGGGGARQRRGMRLDGLAAAGAQAQGREREEDTDVRLMIGVTSACCTNVSLARREAVRRTWAALARQRYPRTLDVRFFLAQPADAETARAWMPALEVRLY